MCRIGVDLADVIAKTPSYFSENNLGRLGEIRKTTKIYVLFNMFSCRDEIARNKKPTAYLNKHKMADPRGIQSQTALSGSLNTLRPSTTFEVIPRVCCVQITHFAKL